MVKQKGSKILIFVMLTMALILAFGTASVFAATIGQQLTSPETGWQRVDDNSTNINYIGTGWTTLSWSGYYGGGEHYFPDTNTTTAKVQFKFYGTQLRIISESHNELSNWNGGSAQVTVDGSIVGTYNTSPTNNLGQVLLYELTGLTKNTHTVEILRTTNNKYFCIDAIDIDSTGYLTLLPNVPTLNTPTVGSSSVSLSWTSVSDATSYNVKRATTAGGPYTTIANSITTSAYSDTTVTNGTTYYYVVSAVNAYGESSNSNEVPAAPTQPVTITSISVSPTSCNLPLNGTQQLTVTAYKSDNSSVDITSTCTWTSSDPTIAAMSSTTTGAAIGVQQGTVTITAKTADGKYTATSTITVSPFSGNRAILLITMVNGTEKEYDLSISDINAFLNWYDNRANGIGKAYYAVNKTNNVKPFLGRREYLIFDKILDFEIKDYNG